MKGLFSYDEWTYPTHIRQMMADQQHSPQYDGEYNIDVAKQDFWVEDIGDPISAAEYLKGM